MLQRHLRYIYNGLINVSFLLLEGLGPSPETRNDLFYQLPLLRVSSPFAPPGLGSYWIRATASYLYVGLVAAALDHLATMAG